ncbi:MAG: SH3 domain-containing protein [Spirochaetales bacterium]
MCSLLSRVVKLFPILFISVYTVACSDRGAGAGVILWSPDEDLVKSGTIVTLLTDSDLSETYIVEAPELDEPLELPRWRVEAFENRADAFAFAESYQSQLEGSTTLYARAGRNALPLRSSPDPAGNNPVYRLREGEVFKLIGREEEQTDLSGLVSYWYEGLTETGQRGWVFGHTLEVFDPTDPSFVIEAQAAQDPLLDLLVSSDWRPIWYVDMITNNTIDLEVFTESYGFWPDPETNSIELVLPWHSTVFDYEEIVRVGSRRYFAEGTSLQMTFRRNDELSIQYVYNDREFVQAFQRIEEDIAVYIEREQSRRDEVYEQIMSRGPSLRSDNYGRLELFPNRRFDWTGASRLVPRVIPESAATTGSIDLGLFLATSLMQQFDGALAFEFDNAEEPVYFVYTLRDDGIRFVYVPPENVTDALVEEEALSPLTIFMSASGG